MSGRLAGKTALITAAGQGIGRATALAMAAEGAQVFATDVNPKLVAALEGTPNIVPRVLDVLDDAAIAKTFAELPPLDILFNCAGFVHHGTILDCAPKDWDLSFNLNVRAMYVTIRCALPKMLAMGGGSIVNMASIASLDQGTAESLRLRHVEGRGDRPHEGDRGRLRDARASAATRSRPGTVDTPSLADRINALRRPRRGAQGVHRAAADGTAREGRGDRAARRVPRVRRSRVRHRQCIFLRWRHDDLTTVLAVDDPVTIQPTNEVNP